MMTERTSAQAARQARTEALLDLNEPRLASNYGRLLTRWPDGLDKSLPHVEGVRKFYLQGNCGVFAAILHERTGWPVHEVYDATSRPGSAGAFHWACLTPGGTYADACGTHRTQDDLKAYYGLGGARPVAMAESSLESLFRRFLRPRHHYGLVRDEHLDLLLPHQVLMLANTTASTPVSKTNKTKPRMRVSPVA